MSGAWRLRMPGGSRECCGAAPAVPIPSARSAPRSSARVRSSSPSPSSPTPCATLLPPMWRAARLHLQPPLGELPLRSR
eukprot:4796896-Alexandrium_andersonii.AAC.1